LNVHGVNQVRQTEIHTAEPPMPEPNVFEVEMADEKLKRHNSPCVDQIPAALIKAGDRTIRSEFHKHINSILNKEEFLEEWKASVIAPVYKSVKTNFSNFRGISLFLTAYKLCPTSCCQG